MTALHDKIFQTWSERELEVVEIIYKRAGETAQMIKCLSHKLEDLDLIPEHPMFTTDSRTHPSKSTLYLIEVIPFLPLLQPLGCFESNLTSKKSAVMAGTSNPRAGETSRALGMTGLPT